MCRALTEAEALTEVDEEPSVAPALILGKNHDAGHIVLLLTVLLLQRGKTHTHTDVRGKSMEKYSKKASAGSTQEAVCAGWVLMEVRRPGNCCVLAVGLHVNGSTCICTTTKV